MSFTSGQVSFRRFDVSPLPTIEQVLSKLDEFHFTSSDDGTSFGFVSHTLEDVQFSAESNVFSGAILFNLRIDTNKVPGALVKSWTATETRAAAAGNPSGFISKAQRLHVRETVKAMKDDALRSGKHIRSRMVPVLLDIAHGGLYTSASGSALDKLAEILERALGIGLIPNIPGEMAMRYDALSYDKVFPTDFLDGSDAAIYPWVARGADPRVWLGNEFFMWLLIRHRDFFFTERMDLDCAFGVSGRDAIEADSAHATAECVAALASGKVPRRATFQLVGDQMSLAGDSMAEVGFEGQITDTFAVSALKLPEIDKSESERDKLEARIHYLRCFWNILGNLYGEFLACRFNTGTWQRYVQDIRDWIRARTQAA